MRIWGIPVSIRILVYALLATVAFGYLSGEFWGRATFAYQLLGPTYNVTEYKDPQGRDFYICSQDYRVRSYGWPFPFYGLVGSSSCPTTYMSVVAFILDFFFFVAVGYAIRYIFVRLKRKT